MQISQPHAAATIGAHRAPPSCCREWPGGSPRWVIHEQENPATSDPGESRPSRDAHHPRTDYRRNAAAHKDRNADRVRNTIDGVLVAGGVLVCSWSWGSFAYVWCSSLSNAGCAGEKGMTVRNLPPVPCCGGSAARSTVT